MQNNNRANSHTMRAAIELRHRILSAQYAGGTRIYEVELAKDLNISRTPVRAALSWLTEEGLVERGRSGGFVVRSFAYQDIADTIELRGVLEGTSARLAAERGASGKRLAEIQALLEELDRCVATEPDGVDFDLYSTLNSRFHLALARLSGSSVIASELERIKRLPFASPSAFLPQDMRASEFSGGLRAAQAQHRAIVQAVASREGCRAEALAREHARIALANLERLTRGGAGPEGALPALALLRRDDDAV